MPERNDSHEQRRPVLALVIAGVDNFSTVFEVIRASEERPRLSQHLTLIEQDGPLDSGVGVQDGPEESTVTAGHTKHPG